MDRFPASVIEKIGSYVYTLADPKTRRIFYVGKGRGNRVFQHARASLRRPKPTDKIKTIRQIRRHGRSVAYEIVRHGLDQTTALEVESALIDFIGRSDLTNQVAGHGADERGRMTIPDIMATYAAKPIRISEPVVLIIVNKLYRRNISAAELYEITRGNWGMGKRREAAIYALSVFRGVVREVYRINSWRCVRARSRSQKRQWRWRFAGAVAPELRHYVGGNVERYLKAGARLPFRYVNCD